MDRAVWTRRLEGALAGESWLLDGNFSSSLLKRAYRADTVYFLMFPRARGQGVASALVRAAETEAARRGKTLLVLDTASEEGAGPFYEKLGYTLTGLVPDFALKPHGGLTGTLFYWKRLG